MQDPNATDPNATESTADADTRRCPSCLTALDHIGTGGDELLECPNCGLVMFDSPH